MRDDVFPISLFRQLVEPGKTTTPALRSALTDPTAPKPSFISALTRATQVHARTNATHAPYKSPLAPKQTHGQQHPTPGARPGLAKPPTLTSPSSSTSAPGQQAPDLKAERAKHAAAAAPPPVRPPAQAAVSDNPLALGAYPHPNGDNGRGMHWVPTTKQSTAIVDRFVAEAKRMGVKWITFLNDGANIGQNDYLVNKLVGAGIEPIMRLYSAKLEPIKGDVEGMVRHYAAMGVHYFQPYNEPNLSIEQPDGVPSVERYLNAWIPAAKAIVRGGGLPGFGSLSPGGDKNDVEFLTEALNGLRARGEVGLLNRGWLSMHNYTHNHPIAERADTDGFFKFRAYNKILRNALGRDLPIIGTEGGTFIGECEDTTLPAVDAKTVVDMTTQAYGYMRDQREPWNFAYSFWTIANEAGGGTDAGFTQHALFNADGTASPIVSALRGLNPTA